MPKLTTKKFTDFLEALGFKNKSAIYEARNRYFSAQGYAKGSTRTGYFTYCHELIECMLDNGASTEEVERAIIFSYVVLDAEKCRLSILKAKEDLNIQELYNKYVLGGIGL